MDPRTERFRKFFSIALIVSLWIVFLFIFPIPKELDFYYYHVWECLQAHAHNMSFCVCSGFWKSPDPSDLENPCIIHPSEDPYQHIAHGSNLGTKVQTFGIVGYLLTDTTVYPPDPSIMENAPDYAKAEEFLNELSVLIAFTIFPLILTVIIVELERKIKWVQELKESENS